MTSTQFETNVSPFKNSIHSSVYFVDAPIGAGKSFTCIKHIKDNPHTKFVIATQTNQLSHSFARDLKKAGISFKLIMVDDKHTRTCRRRYAAAVRGKHQVIIVNQAVAFRRFKKPVDRVIFFDEIPNIYAVQGIDFDKIPFFRDDFVDAFSKADRLTEIDGYYDLTITKALIDLKLVLVKHQHLDRDLKDLFVLLCDPNNRALVDAKRFGRIMQGKKEWLYFNFFVKPDVLADYQETIILGANFERSILYRHWQTEVNFVPHQGLRDGLQYADLSHKAPFVKLYGMSERNISSGLFDGIDGGRQTYVNAAGKAFQKLRKLEDVQDHIWTSNIQPGTNKPYKWTLKGGRVTYVSPDPRGSNEYMSYDASIHMAALNPIPETFNVLKAVCGMNKADVYAATAWERIYQWHGRTSFRDKDCTRTAYLICPDMASACYIQSLIPGCADPEFLDIGIQELKATAPATDTTRSADKRANQRLAAQNQVEQPNGFPFALYQKKEFKPKLTTDNSFQGIFAYLEHAAINDDKPADKLGGKMFRGGDGLTSRLLILDIDKCKRDPRELSAWLKQNGMTHLIFYTHRSTIKKPRIRVVIPLSEAVDAESYSHIFKLIRADIWVRFSKDYRVDAGSCGTVHAHFFMPTISENGAPIEEIVWTDILAQEAKLFDVRLFLKRALKEAKAGHATQNAEDVVSLDADKTPTVTPFEIIEKYAVAASREAENGSGDTNHYKAGIAFRDAGYPAAVAEFHLHQNRKRFGHGKDAGAAKRVVKSVYNRGRTSYSGNLIGNSSTSTTQVRT